jgi:hypothetical protein
MCTKFNACKCILYTHNPMLFESIAQHNNCSWSIKLNDLLRSFYLSSLQPFVVPMFMFICKGRIVSSLRYGKHY